MRYPPYPRRRTKPGPATSNPTQEVPDLKNLRGFAHPAVALMVLTLFYLTVLAGLVALYGRGDFSTPSFVYQDF